MPLLKRLASGEPQTYRRLHEGLQTRKVTATIVLACNPGSIPRLKLQDAAMADRLCELPYPAVPEPDPGFRERIATEEFRTAFFARLVREATDMRNKLRAGEPPPAPRAVKEATRLRVHEDQGEIGQFSRRIAPADPSDTLKFADVWAAWCEHVDDEKDSVVAGGISKPMFGRRLRGFVEGLPSPQPRRLAGEDGKRRSVRVWVGWTLLDAPSETESWSPRPHSGTAERSGR